MTSFADRVSRFWRDNQLFAVLIELTYRCNLDCVFCYNDLGRSGRALVLDDYRRLLDELAELGALHVALTGGEPLAHPDFFAIGAAARERGFVVRVKSNGHALRGRLARRLRDEVDPFLVEISLHGAQGSTHDRQTRVPGSFERLMANLVELCELGLRVQLNSTLTAWNETEIEPMHALADALGLPLHVDPEVTPRDDGDRSPLTIAPSAEGIARLVVLQTERAARAGGAAAGKAELPTPTGAAVARKHCGAGSSHLTIDPYGEVYPCVQWRVSVGNVHERLLREIWAGGTGLDAVRSAEGEVHDRIAALGPVGRSIGFCPGIAHQETGDPAALYGAARLRRDLHVRMAERAGHPALPVIS